MTKTTRAMPRHRSTLLAALLASGFAAALPAAAAEAWTATATTAHDVRGARHIGPLAQATDVHIVVSLKLRNKAQLDALTSRLVAGAADAQALTPQQFLAQHAPTAAQADAVASYLRQQGFRDVKVADNRLLVSATGSAAAVKQAFQADLHAYDVDGRSAYANVTDALVPQHLADSVQAVVGLQSVHLPHVHAQVFTGTVAPLATTGTVSGVTITDFPALYSASSLPSATTANIGIITQGNVAQTIADLQTFAARAGYPAPTVTTTVVGGASTDTSNLLEWNLDTQTSLAAAGGTVASLILYDVPALTDAALTAGYNQAVVDNKARAINVSIGICEKYEPSSVIAADDQIFQAAVAQGQTFSVSSGDSGANECGGGNASGQSYPSTSPWVIAVGGTTLTHSGGTWGGETVWSGAGGGPSVIEPAPAWQLAAGVLGTSTKRGTPDISFDANPSSGALVLINGALQQVGGTSLAAPLWAGFWSRIQAKNGNVLPFPAQTLYAGAATHTYWFHDIYSGSQGYSAAGGWDYASGWGSLYVGNFAAATFISGSVGTLSFVSGTHSALDSGGDIATLKIRNTGIGTITGITYTCGASATAAGSWYKYNTSSTLPPTSLAPGAVGTFQCVAAASGMFNVYINLTGTNATNSPYAVSF